MFAKQKYFVFHKFSGYMSGGRRDTPFIKRAYRAFLMGKIMAQRAEIHVGTMFRGKPLYPGDKAQHLIVVTNVEQSSGDFDACAVHNYPEMSWLVGEGTAGAGNIEELLVVSMSLEQLLDAAERTQINSGHLFDREWYYNYFKQGLQKGYII